MMTRRSLCLSALALAASLSAGAVRAAGEPAEVDVRLAFIPNAEYADYFVAIDKGYFADAGMTVNLIPGGQAGGKCQGAQA